ncbi:MAG: hypothetical protein A2218_10455 [Elusimicrobia bacterium RIFOXYA2_FULL_53_38]|nr:MAG: hypothetical protein A2218_10455 [Elusimicrobia bacterium RIFOXYA2_FULL_53_38]
MKAYHTEDFYIQKIGKPGYFKNLVFSPRSAGKKGLLSGDSHVAWGVPARITHVPKIFAIWLNALVAYFDEVIENTSSTYHERLKIAGWHSLSEGAQAVDLRRKFLEKYLYSKSRKLNLEIVRVIGQSFKEQKHLKVLDVGCGISVLYDELPEKAGYRGIDVSKRVLESSFAPLEKLLIGEYLQVVNNMEQGGFHVIVDCLCSKDIYTFPKNRQQILLEAPEYRSWLSKIYTLLVEGGLFIHVRPKNEFEERKAKKPTLLPFEAYLTDLWKGDRTPAHVGNYAIYTLRK